MGASISNLATLNDDDIVRVKTSWMPVMENAEANGILIFKTFLDRYQYYRLFNKFAAVPAQEIADHKAFQKHSLAIMKTIDGVVVNLENEGKIRQDLIELGSFHRLRNVSEQQFQELKAIIMEIFERAFTFPVETLQAWNKTFDLTFPYLLEGLTASVKAPPTKSTKSTKSTKGDKGATTSFK